MNKIYRLVWSKSRKTLIAVAENTTGQGKSGSKSATVGTVLASTVMALGGLAFFNEAQAQPPCTNVTGTTAMSGGNCYVVQAGTTFTGGVTAISSSFSSFSNAGLINRLSAGLTGVVLLSNSTSTGGITNSGTIYGPAYAIYAGGSSPISGGINNSGSLAGFYAPLRLGGSGTLDGGITNSGVINGGTYGIYVANAVTNGGIQNTGTISGANTGGFLNAAISGGITNSGKITGNTRGLTLSFSPSFSGGIINSGTIQATGAGGGGLVLLQGSTLSGGLQNNSGGLIYGGSAGIGIKSSVITGGINNSGSIGGGGFDGIYLKTSSTLTGGITNSGSITGGVIGVAIRSGSLQNGINNSRMITGGNTGIGLLNGSLSGGITNSGKINGGTYGFYVGAGSTISGGIQNVGGTVSGNIGIINAGMISGGIAIAIKTNAILSGGISNSGTILGTTGNAIFIRSNATLTGGIMNTGKISGVNTGILVTRTSTFSGGITNSGSIGGVNAGIVVQNGSSLIGGITNSGTISGLAGVKFTASALTGGMTNSGIINGGSYGIYVDATSSIAGGIINTNTISGGVSGIYNTGTISGLTVGISNSAGGFISGGIKNVGSIGSGATGILLNASSISGGVNNSGSISGNQAIVISRSTFTGGITNSGLISGTKTAGMGIKLNASSLSGGIINSGTISATDYALYLLPNSTVSGGLSNTGSLGGNIAIVLSRSAFTGGVNNSGTLGGNIAGLNLISTTVSGGITNSGAIFGSSNTSGVGLQLANSVISNGINNSGTINGIAAGINMVASTISGGITNTGVIMDSAAPTRAGISINAASSIDTITNITGTITGAFGIFNSGAIGTLINGQGGVGNGGNRAALTYSGVLPNSYQIFVASPTNYGQLSGTSVSGTMSFTGIAAGSAVASQLYTKVLSGVTVAQLGTSATATGMYNGYTWSLIEEGSSNNWDLSVTNASYVTNTAANNNPAGAGAAQNLTNIAANPTPAMAPVITALNALSGQAQSNAISQTLPVVVGASSLATANSQRGLSQIVQARQSAVAGLSAGEDFIASRDVWMKAFGGWANQNDVNNVSGYKINTGGLAIGGDYALSPKSNVGGVFAFANSNVNGNNAAAPSSVSVNSYQIGGYGDTALRADMNWNYQADIGVNQNTGSRGINFMGTTANSSYNSYSAHLGTGVTKLYPLTPDTRFIPSVRADYLTVQSQSYTETNAGALNLNVNSQTYQELLASANFRLDHDLTDKLKLTGNVGAGYNLLNNQVQITSTYAGGGAAFATNGLQISPWLYNAGLGIVGQIDKGYELTVRYDVQATTSGYLNQMASAKLRISF